MRSTSGTSADGWTDHDVASGDGTIDLGAADQERPSGTSPTHPSRLAAAILEWSAESVMRIDANGAKVLHAGAAMGWAKHEFNSHAKLSDLLSARDRERVVRAAYAIAKTPGARERFTADVVYADGTQHPVDLRLVNAQNDPRINGLLVYALPGSGDSGSFDNNLRAAATELSVLFASSASDGHEATIRLALQTVAELVGATGAVLTWIENSGRFARTRYAYSASDERSSAIDVGRVVVHPRMWIGESKPVRVSNNAAAGVVDGHPRDLIVVPRVWSGGRTALLAFAGPIGFDVERADTLITTLADLSGAYLARLSADRRLSASQARHDALIEHSPDLLVLLSNRMRVQWASPSACRYFGQTVAELRGQNFRSYLHPDDRDLEAPTVAQPSFHTGRLLSPTLGWRWFESAVRDLHHDHAVGAYLVNCRDITEARAADVALRRQQSTTELLSGIARRFAKGESSDIAAHLASTAEEVLGFLGASMASIWETDDSGQHLVPRQTFSKDIDGSGLTPLALRSILERAPQLRDGEVVHERPYLGEDALTSVVEQSDLPRISELVVIPILNEGRVLGLVIVTARTPVSIDRNSLQAMRSVSEVLSASFAKFEAERTLRLKATTDDLTGLSNRAALRDLLDQALAECRQRGEGLGVALLDLDQFKIVNDTLGHESGDDLLRMLGARLRSTLREKDGLARLGGDEFVVVIKEVPEVGIPTLDDRLKRVFVRPFHIGGKSLRLTASIGVAFANPSEPESMSAAELLRRADVAMYRSKHDGRGRMSRFDDEMDRSMFSAAALALELRGGLAASEFEAWMQPVVDTVTQRVCGLEALARWRHPEHGVIAPGTFIDVAERSGLIHELGAFVLDSALGSLRELIDEGLLGPDAFVAVNVSAIQLDDDNFLDQLRAALRRHDLSESQLQVELTESVLAEERHRQRLQAIRDTGIQIAIDDFGTGYSSLSYARDLPADTLKLDRSFISGVSEDRRDQAVSAAVITMAHALGMRVVAEGVEKIEQLEQLEALGCDRCQGYYFGRPMPGAELRSWLVEHERVASLQT